MTLKNTLYLTILISFLSALNACSSTRLIEHWSSPSYKGPKLEKILVIGIIKNKKNREMFEREFSQLITTNTRTGITSFTHLSDLEHSVNKEHILDIVKKTEADGVMIVTTRGTFERDRVTRGSVEHIPGANRGLYGYYAASHSFVYTPGHTVTDTFLRIDTKLFSAATEEMIWSGVTESFNPDSSEDVIHELENIVITNMQHSGMIN